MNRLFKSPYIDYFLPVILLSFLAVLFHQTSLDEMISGFFYTKKDLWLYRDNFFLEKILHKGGVLFTIFCFLALALRLRALWSKPEHKQQKDFLCFVLFASILTIVSIFILKRWTTFPCPWHAATFGGSTGPIPIWLVFSSTLPNPHCFPGGHSSGGYAFLSLYYGYLYIYKKRKYSYLIPGLFLGVVFGLTQQIRGAHFMSHDISTIIISIIMSWLTSLIFSFYNIDYET